MKHVMTVARPPDTPVNIVATEAPIMPRMIREARVGFEKPTHHTNN